MIPQLLKLFQLQHIFINPLVQFAELSPSRLLVYLLVTVVLGGIPVALRIVWQPAEAVVQVDYYRYCAVPTGVAGSMRFLLLAEECMLKSMFSEGLLYY